MSKLPEALKEEVKDDFEEHDAFHQSFHRGCSSCFKEATILNAKRIVDRPTHADLLKKYPALRSLDTHINNEIERN